MRGPTEMKKNWLAIIHVAKSQLNLDDETYRAILKTRYGVTSARDLAAAQGKDLIDYFKSLGFMPPPQKKVCSFCAPRPPRDEIPKDVIYPVSPQQLALVRKLKNDITWKTVDGFNRWLKRYFRIQEIKTSAEASMVIVALKGLWRSQHRCKCSFTERYFKSGTLK